MISEDLIDMLVDPDPEVRKRGVMQLGKSKDPDALPYLAEVYRDDEDAEVRELARKAGLFIRKNAPAGGGRSAATAPAPRRSSAPESSYSDLYGSSDDLYANNDDDDDVYAEADSSPLPSELKVGRVQEERAQGLIQQALDLNMRGDNQRATKALEKALNTNPKLMYDNYTISLASTITGMDGREAVKMLGPSSDELSKRRSGGTTRRSGTQILFAYSLIMSGVIVLFGYFVLPWFNIGQIEVEGLNGTTMSVSKAWEEIATTFETNAQGVNSNEVEILQDAFNSINFEVSGLNTTLFAIGSANLADTTGFTPMFELTSQFIQGLFTAEDFEVIEYTHDTEPLDYTLLLVPIAAIIAGLLGIILLIRLSFTLWILAVLVGLAGIAGMAYYFTIGEERIRTGIDWGTFMEVPMPEMSLIGIGFWVSLVGMLVVIVVPFLAMLTMPAQQDEF